MFSERVELRKGHLLSWERVKVVTFGGYIADRRGTRSTSHAASLSPTPRSTVEEMPRIQLNSWAVPAFCICESSAAYLGYGRVVPIPAGGRVQYQLLDRDSYEFGYDTGTGPSQSFREETRDSDGTVRGRYGYIDPLGTLRIVDYMADHTGFHIISSVQLTSQTTRKPRDPIQLPFLGAIPPFLPRQNSKFVRKEVD
ncbi:unnamed protein product [Larinioides sclopetarius]|uniref:Uncharacterized protein n=1 Tax=Larinioides sclopetarius TaxID=280406 RepID=A0AAV1ZZR1_9ARAC